tara:strand:- start:110 stop:469 length:360 start_codon:yes stop_codon:yes gene_type:complete
MESLKLFYRIWEKSQDEILLHLMDRANQCGNRLLRLNLEINLSNVLPKGISGLGVSKRELDQVTEGMWDKSKWREDRSPFHLLPAPEIEAGQRSAVFKVMDDIDIDLEKVSQLVADYPK